jgi:hypothetical protein
MTEQHPITPPNELVRKWLENYFGCWDDVTIAAADVSRYIAAKSTQWGHEQRGADIEDDLQKARDEELEACCEHLQRSMSPRATIDYLRAARRPKPPSLKEQALMALEDGDTGPGASLTPTEVSIIRRALEALPDD